MIACGGGGMKKTFAVIIVGALFLSTLWVLTPAVKAEGPVQVYIGSDGTVAPSFAPVSSRDNVTYALTGNISYPAFDGIVVERSNIVIDGNGYAVQGNGSKLVGVRLTGSTNVTIENIIVEGFNFGVFLYSSNNSAVVGITATAIRPYIFLGAPSAYPYYPHSAGIVVSCSSFDTISGNDVTLNGADGIVLQSSSNNTVTGNNVTANSVNGIDLLSSSYNSLVGNDLTGNDGCGIFLQDSCDNTFATNLAAADKRDGFELDFSSGNVLRANRMVGNVYAFGVLGSQPTDFVNDVDASNTVDGRPIYYWISEHDRKLPVDAGCIVLANCSGMTVQGTNLTENENSILLAYTTNSTITQNNITHNDYGIVFMNSSNNVVSRNTVTGNEIDAISVDNSDNNSISENTVTADGHAGIDLSDSSNNIVSGNNVNANATCILLGNSNNNTVNKNIATGAYQGIFLFSSAFNTISANNATANDGDGIEVGFSSNNTITGNTATANGQNGILFEGSSNNTVIGNTATLGNCGICLGLLHGLFSPQFSSSCNTVAANSLEENKIGLQLSSASNNTIYHNNFIENSVQVSVDPASANNSWNEPYPSGGNYWSDYNGSDVFSGPYQNETGSDGIGDMPYIVGDNNTDLYPLRNPYVLNYSVVFTEVGLPNGVTWWVDLNGDNQSSASGLISFSKANGMYTYSTGASGHTASPSKGSVIVNGANTTEQVTFTRALNCGLIMAAIVLVLGTAFMVTGFLMWRRKRVDNRTEP
jgi:parallel beta-helix repeat protein